MVRLEKTNLKASTLIESLIAMVLIVLCLGIAMMIYLNVLSSDKQLLKQKAYLLLNNESKRIKNDNNFIEEEKWVDEWKIVKQIVKYNQTENLLCLRLLLIDRNGEVVLERNELIIEK